MIETLTVMQLALIVGGLGSAWVAALVIGEQRSLRRRRLYREKFRGES